MRKKFLASLFLAACILVNTTVYADNNNTDSSLSESQQNRAEREYHVETMSKLVLGYYHGAWKVCEILNMGSIVEAPPKVDRSIVVFNNKLYQLLEKEPLDDPDTLRTTALATIHGIDKPTETVIDQQNLALLSSNLEAEIQKYGKNGSKFYIVQMQGEFSNLVLQSVPDKNWVQEQMNGQFRIHADKKYNKLKGTVTGIRMVDYLKSGRPLVWYLHFASEDKTVSGIIVNMNIEHASLKISPVSDFSIYVPIWTEEK